MKQILIQLLLSLPLLANQNCPEAQSFGSVDLRPSLPPLRHQDSIGWCASFTSADLLTNWMQNSRERLGMSNVDFSRRENMISAAGVALAFNNAGKREGQRLKIYQDSIERARYEQELSLLRTEAKSLRHRIEINGGDFQVNEDYLSLQSQIEEIQTIVRGLAPYEEPHGGIISKIFSQLKSEPIYSEGEIPSDSYELSNLEDALQSVYDLYTPSGECLDASICNASQMIHQVFPNMELAQISDILSRGFVQGEDPLKELLERATPLSPISSDSFPTVDTFSSREKNGSGQWAYVRQKLQEGKLVAVSYGASCILPEPVARDGHLSSFAGYYYDCNRREPVYILRNSWGEQRCQGAYEIILAQKMDEMSEDAAKASMPFECQDGYYMVYESTIERSISTVSTLQ